MDLVLSIYSLSFLRRDLSKLHPLGYPAFSPIAILAPRDLCTTRRVLVEYHIRKLSELQSECGIMLKKAKYRIPHRHTTNETSSRVTLLMFCKM